MDINDVGHHNILISYRRSRYDASTSKELEVNRFVYIYAHSSLKL
jgi:hypothetical protein